MKKIIHVPYSHSLRAAYQNLKFSLKIFPGWIRKWNKKRIPAGFSIFTFNEYKSKSKTCDNLFVLLSSTMLFGSGFLFEDEFIYININFRDENESHV